jgi:hypothetical protein
MRKARGLPMTLQEHSSSSGLLPPAGAAGGTMSKSSFARLIGVTPGRVSQLIAKGMPTEPDGTVDVAKAKAWIRDNIDPTRGHAKVDEVEGPLPLPPPTSTPRSEKTAEETAFLRTKRERLQGTLISKAETLQAIETRSRAERDSWLGWVNRIAPEMARATNADLAMVVALLDRHVREQLATLASVPIGDIRK